jgi:hypothetical protein
VNFLDLYLCHWNDRLLWIKRQRVSYLIKLQKFYRRSCRNGTRFNGAKFIVYILGVELIYFARLLVKIYCVYSTTFFFFFLNEIFEYFIDKKSQV